MTDHDDSDTELAPTEHPSPAIAELQSDKHAEPPQAGSLDDATEAESAPPPNWHARAAALTFLATIVLMTLIPPLESLFKPGGSKHVEPEAKPSTNVPVAAPPSAPTVALQKPATVTPTPDFSVYDEKFLFLMTQEGWRCTGNLAVDQCKRAMVNFAHEICSYSGLPIDLVYQNFSPPAFLGPREERTAIAKAEQSYPNCTLTSGP
jgi:hypothetical protein